MPRLPHSTPPTTVYEDVVFNGNLTLPQAYDVEEDDAEYDVYLFWPSTSPHLLTLEEDGTEGDFSEARIATCLLLACA